MPKPLTADAWGNVPVKTTSSLLRALNAIVLAGLMAVAARGQTFATADEFAPNPKYHTTVTMGPIPGFPASTATAPTPTASSYTAKQSAYESPLPSPETPTPAATPAFTKNGWEEPPVAATTPPNATDAAVPECTNMPADGKQRRYIADIELLALRTHFSEDPLGKLGEHYELSERIMIGVEKPNGIGGRIRYWSYDRTTPNLQGGSPLGADFSVTDFEGTTNFTTQSFDLTLAGGIRFADIRLDTDTGHVRSNQMPGATIALDLRGIICGDETAGCEWHSISGARLSILGCDWRSDNGIIGETRDDNITAMEVYGGFECSHCIRGHELNLRIIFEAQNWRSDALGENTGIDSIGFVGPGMTFGINY